MSNPASPEPITKGHRLFDKWLSEAGHSNAYIASILGVHRATVGTWRGTDGRWTPEVGYRRAIEILSAGKVPARSWETPAERAIVQRAREAIKLAKQSANASRAA